MRASVCFLPFFSFLTHTRAPGAVQGQALAALAAEGALSVYALAVCAHAGEDFTLIDVCGNLKNNAECNPKKAFIVKTDAKGNDRPSLPSQMRPFIRANPREQAVSEERREVFNILDILLDR